MIALPSFLTFLPVTSQQVAVHCHAGRVRRRYRLIPPLLWLAAAFYLTMLGLVAEVALSSERESARETPTAREVR